MNDVLELTPALLLEQSQEMNSLKAAYDNLFGNITSELQGINSSWSELLANNFSGKIGAAQKTFLGSLTMLENSASAAKIVADTFADADTGWAAKLGGSSLQTLQSALTSVLPSAIKGDYAYAGEFLNEVATGGEDSARKMGTGEKVLKTAMALGKGALATIGCVGAWAGALGTGGLAIPGAAISTAFTANTLASCGSDVYNMWFGNEALVGEVNILKESMTTAGGDLSEMLIGNRDVGELVGKSVYNVGQTYTDIVNAKGIKSLFLGEIGTSSDLVATKDKLLSKTPAAQYGKIAQNDVTGETVVEAVKEVPKALSGGWDILKHTPIQELGKDCKLLSYEIPNLVEVYEGGELLYKMGVGVENMVRDGAEFLYKCPEYIENFQKNVRYAVW